MSNISHSQPTCFMRPVLVAAVLAAAAANAHAEDFGHRMRRSLDPRGAGTAMAMPNGPDAALQNPGVLAGAILSMGGLRSIQQHSEQMLPQGMAAPADDGQVVMYRTAWCGYCKLAATHMQQRGVPYVEYDIERDLAAKAQFNRYGGSGGVPLIVLGRKTMRGFEARAFDAAYAQFSSGQEVEPQASSYGRPRREQPQPPMQVREEDALLQQAPAPTLGQPGWSRGDAGASTFGRSERLPPSRP